MIVGDLGVRLAHHAQKRRLAHVGKAHQAHIRQELQLQNDIVALPGETRLGKAGYLAGRGGKMLVAPAAPAALAQDIRFLIRHILDDLAGFRVPN